MDYISPTSFLTYKKSREEFYLRYLASVRPPRQPQTPAMAIGSVFDGYIKHFLITRLDLGECCLEELLASQVEEQNRHLYPEGKALMEKYVRSGCLDDIFLELKECEGNFVSELYGTVGGVPIFGKPDAWWSGTITDWKVNGYFSKSPVSPNPGYYYCEGKRHDKYKDGMPLQDINREWAIQLTFYSWLLGSEAPFVGRIEQLVCGGGRDMRVAKFKGMSDPVFTEDLRKDVIALWDGITGGTLYSDEEVEEYERKATYADVCMLKTGMNRW